MGLAITSCLMLASKDAEAGYFATITIDGLYADWAGVPAPMAYRPGFLATQG